MKTWFIGAAAVFAVVVALCSPARAQEPSVLCAGTVGIGGQLLAVGEPS